MSREKPKTDYRQELPNRNSLHAPLIHIGLHKTGTSWLQANLFSNAEAGFCSPWTPNEYIERLIISNPFAYDPENTFEYFFNRISKNTRGSCLHVLSHEMLSGNPWKGGQYANRAAADRLFETFPDARVLIVIREQVSMVSSLYRHHVRNGLAVPITRYLQLPKAGGGFEPLFRWEYVEYHWLIGHYQALFGADRVLVLPFELLRRDCDSFAQQICQFVGLPSPPILPRQVVNTGYNALTTSLKYRVNRFVSADKAIGKMPWHYQFAQKVFYRLDRYSPKNISARANRRLCDEIRDAFGDHFRDSNCRTAELAGLDLRSYGYMV